MNSTKLTTREWIHKMVDEVDEAYLKTLLWAVQSFVTASVENKKEEQKHEES